ncbi:Protein of unknown function [Desulfocicer vacuolatum DSM 3385]|uniref:Uncharacterized protein n=2 Tax=Desulfocicer vacuolatum TaxID=2298 RepID=A0A1W2BPE5_9BACT|nr:Protein of unknown function [Desulfocicer vacuolatum DSM 3385]
MADSPTLIENPMLSTIDGSFAKEMEKLISDNSDKTNVCLYNLSIFLGFLSARHPIFIKEFQSGFEKRLITEILKHARTDENAKKKAQEMGIDLYDESEFEEISFSESRNVTLVKMIENAQKNAKFIHYSMGWLFLHSLEVNFLLCDDPFIVKDRPIEVRELISHSDEYIALIPLSRQLCLALSSVKKDIKHEFIKEDQARVINNLVIGNAKKWVIGATKESLENV